MAEASTPGIFCLHQKQVEQQRNLTLSQEKWSDLRQPRASKRAAVNANAVGGGKCFPPTYPFFLLSRCSKSEGEILTQEG